MLLQFLLKHGIDDRAPFRSGNRRIRHDGIIYALKDTRERQHKWIRGGQSARPSFPGSGPGAGNRLTKAARAPCQSA